MYQEGDNVSQTNTTSKNTRQHHPPRTVPPSKSPTQPTIPDRSTLSIQNTATVPPSQSGQNLRKSGSLGQSGGRFGYWRVIRLLEGDSIPGR